jgi:DNA-directed RNA polymerase specialized sigma24 family protein
MSPTDSDLLRAFVEANDKAGFAELVGRRIDFVYAAALRQVSGDTHRADDITQEVFVKLARNAPKLCRHPALLGWLCLTTRSTAVDMIRRRVARAEQENTRLLAETSTLTAAATPTGETITSDMVTQRFRRAQELVSSGDPSEALRELIWCYDVGMPHVGLVGPVRSTSLLIFGKLGERHPPALEWLRERRAAAKQRALEDERDRDSITEYATMNRALGDHIDTVATMDSLPEGDRRRRELASSAHDYLVDQQRYNDAMAGTSFALLSTSFERRASGLRDGPSDAVSAWTARAIEVLAGSGDLVHARELADRLFKVDGSETTRALIQRHVQRAGHPTLLSATPTAP